MGLCSRSNMTQTEGRESREVEKSEIRSREAARKKEPGDPDKEGRASLFGTSALSAPLGNAETSGSPRRSSSP